MGMVAKLPAVAGVIGIVELHAEPQVHIPVCFQCPGSHVQGIPLLPRFYASNDRFGQLPDIFSALERLSCDGPEYGSESHYRVLL